jgi:hypothetical protein
MRSYPKNSPEAMTRIVSIAMMSDANLDHQEIATVDEYRIYDIFGLSRENFLQVLINHCRDLLTTSRPTVKLLDKEMIDFTLAEIDEREKQLQICSAILVLSQADGDFSASEQALLSHVLQTWQISLEDLQVE